MMYNLSKLKTVYIASSLYWISFQHNFIFIKMWSLKSCCFIIISVLEWDGYLVKAPVTKTDNLRLIPHGTLMEDGEVTPPSCLLTHTYIHTIIHTYIHMERDYPICLKKFLQRKYFNYSLGYIFWTSVFPHSLHVKYLHTAWIIY